MSITENDRKQLRSDLEYIIDKKLIKLSPIMTDLFNRIINRGKVANTTIDKQTK